MLKDTTYHLVIKKQHERIFDQLLQEKKIEFTKSKGIANNSADSSDTSNPRHENYFIYCLLNVNASTIFSIGLEVGANGNA